MADVVAKFVSQKISKTRWRPSPNRSLQQSDVFVSGSWDDEENKISLWQTPGSEQDDDNIADPTALERDPRLLCEVTHSGDVTGLEFTNAEHIVASSSTGTVTLYKHHRNNQTLGVVSQWFGIHYDPDDIGCPCTCVCTQGEDMVVTGGEDGRLNVLNVSHRKPVRIIDKADSCSINAVAFLKQVEVITVNSCGQLKIFDLRNTQDEPVKKFSLSGEQTPLHCVVKHPTQHHIVATGGQDGLLTIWDLRQDKYPVTLLEAHSAAMYEVKFHPNNPDHLFSCSEDGSVWHWDASSVASLVTGTGAGSGGGSMFTHHTPGGSSTGGGLTSPWLSLEAGRHKMEISTLLPNQTLAVNTLDIESQTLVCGTDVEVIYTIEIPGLR